MAAKRFVAAPPRPVTGKKAPVTVKRTWKRRLKRFSIGLGIAIVLVGVIIPVGSFLWENHVADQNIATYQATVKSGSESTAKLKTVLDDPGVKLFLADPYFTTDADWKAFAAQVHADDVIALAQVKTQLLATVDTSSWPPVRDKVTAYTKTMTLSMDTDTRLKLYAAAAYVEVCENWDTNPSLPMFARGPVGLGTKVVAVAKTHCANGAKE